MHSIDERTKPQAARRRLESLKTTSAEGFRPSFLFFYGHRPLPVDRIGKACLSQWWPSSFTVEGNRYETAEHFMMAQKARFFGDLDAFARILVAPHPAEAKKLGRQVKGFDERAWRKHRFDIVVRGNLAKFSQSRRLEQFLLGTGEQVLVEASPTDRVWGIGLAASDPSSNRPEFWRGLNLLGFALMEVRDRLLSQRSDAR
jgi:ribA/ribD-fused uncharacterized protein